MLSIRRSAFSFRSVILEPGLDRRGCTAHRLAKPKAHSSFFPFLG
jgi:hypothetical protein